MAELKPVSESRYSFIGLASGCAIGTITDGVMCDRI